MTDESEPLKLQLAKHEKRQRGMREFRFRIRVGNKSLLLNESSHLQSIIGDLLAGGSRLRKEPVALGEISITLEPAPPPPPEPEWKDEA